MAPPSVKNASLKKLSISKKEVSKKNRRRKQHAPKPLSHFLRPVSEEAEKKRNEITKFLQCELVGAETYTCPKYKPRKDDVIFRKQGESIAEWRVRQQDIRNFIHEDWFGDTTHREKKRRGASAAFGMVSKAKLNGNLLLEARAALARRKALWEAHQMLCGCGKRARDLEEAPQNSSTDEVVKDNETRSKDDQAMEIE